MSSNPRAALRLALALACLAAAAPPGTAAAPPGTAVAPAATPAAATPEAAAPAASSPATAAPDAVAPAAEEESLERRLLPLEIATSTFYELASRARSLGLEDSGSVEELRARLYKHFGLEAPQASEAQGRSVSIDRAATASYYSVDESGGLVRASGGVILSLTEKTGDTHRIEAREIIYDRSRNAVTARGGIRYVRTSSGSTEIFTGESLSVDLDDWSGVFLDGKVRRSGAATSATPGERGLVLAAETMWKRSSDVMVFDKGVISSCDEDDPHYAVRAGKVWLLGDREWAISDIVFSLGNVPIMWLPFFYYPGDELVFHPVFGYRTREGRYVQTTTYLLGKKPKSTTATSFLKLADDGKEGPTRLNGLFLRRIAGEATDQTGATLKAMADVYSSLGGAISLQGSFPKAGPLDRLSFYAVLGLSRTLFGQYTGGYSPFDAAGNWESVWNGSDFFGFALPLRYGMDFSSSFKVGPLSGTVALPFFSDPYIESDFKNRSEDMDWLKALSTSKDTSSPPAARTQLIQKLDFSLSFQPQSLSPYLASIDLQRVGVSLSWLSKKRSPALNANDPTRDFFFPSSFRPIDAAASLRGTAFKYPFVAPPAQAAPKAPAQGEEGAADASGGGSSSAALPELLSPWEAPDAEAKAPEGGTTSAPAAASVLGFRLPGRAPSVAAASAARAAETWAASLDWSLSPSGFLEDRYKDAAWLLPSSVDLALLSRLASYRLAATLDARAAYRGDLVAASLGLSYSDQAQGRPEDNSGSAVESNKIVDAQYKARRLGAAARLSSRPFPDSPLFSSTSFSWSMDSTLYYNRYEKWDASKATAVFKESFLAWDPTIITSHNASVSVLARFLGFGQSLSLTASLPPLNEAYSARFSLDAGFGRLSVEARASKPAAGGSFTFDPLTASLSLGASPGPTLNDSFVFDAAKAAPVSNSASVAWGPFSASLTAKRTKSYKPVVAKGWVEYGEESFAATDVGLYVKPEWKSDAAAATSWSLAPSLSFSQNLLRFSESNLALGLSVSLKLSGLGTITLTGQSQNSSAWHYFPEAFPALSILGKASDFRVNPLEDLGRSLAVWDPDALKKTLFKLRGLSLKLVHELHDWDLTVEASIKPLLKSASKTYVLDGALSVLLAWRDIAEIKSQLKYDSEGIQGGASKLSY